MNLCIIIPIHVMEHSDDVDAIFSYNTNLSKHKWNEITFHKTDGYFINRADAMNDGFNKHCKENDYVMFLHCDTKLPCNYAEKLYDFFFEQKTIPFCFFRLSFDTTEQLITPKIIEYFVNESRKEPYGDQCFTMSSSFFRNNGLFQSLLLLEDVAFYRVIQKRYDLIYDDHVITECAITSDRRFRSEGKYISELSFCKNVCNNRIIIMLHKLGVSPNVLGKWYYKNNLCGSLNG